MVLLATAASMAISSVAFAAPQHPTNVTLWNQNANFGPGVVSDNFLNNPVYNSTYDAAAADDFVVPSGETWYISEVDVTGAYAGGTGPATSFTVTFYKNKRNRPGRKPHAYTVTCTDNAGSLECPMPMKRGHPAPVLLGGYTWWVSVVANCDYNAGCNEWQWSENTSVTGLEAMWSDPYGGWHIPCGAWEKLDYCFGGSPADMAFDLVGYSAP